MKTINKASRAETITMSHGSGGLEMKELIERVFLTAFGGKEDTPLEDQARHDLASLSTHGDRLAFTTDSYVVDPIFFPGGDIGSLSIHGTLNDLCVGGARPLFISCSFILEEGLPLETLQRIVESMGKAASSAKVEIVTGDTKVVERGAADKLFITTAGIGVIPKAVNISIANAQPGDMILINGGIGEHGAAILAARDDLALDTDIRSDSVSLADLVKNMLKACPGIRAMRDATRGGIATVLNEIASASNVSIRVEESKLPIKESVRGLCEILGLDPLYLACEGRLIVVCPPDNVDELLNEMRKHPLGADSEVVGTVEESRKQGRGTVSIATNFGGLRLIDLLVGEQLPRIC